MNTLMLLNALNALSTPLAEKTANSWLAIVGTVAVSIVSILIIISIVKDVWNYVKGQGSTSAFAIIGKIIFLILMIGLIILIQGKKFNTMATGVGQGAMNKVNSVANDILK